MLAKLWGKRMKLNLSDFFQRAQTETRPTTPAVGRRAPGWAQRRGCSNSMIPPPPRRKSKAQFAGSARARPRLLASVIASGAEKPIGKAGLGEALRRQTCVQSRGYVRSTVGVIGVPTRAPRGNTGCLGNLGSAPSLLLSVERLLLTRAGSQRAKGEQILTWILK